MGQGQVNPHIPLPGQTLGQGAMALQAGLAGGVPLHFQLLPGKRGHQPRAQRLEQGLLGGETSGEMDGRPVLTGAVGDFPGGEDPLEETPVA